MTRIRILVLSAAWLWLAATAAMAASIPGKIVGWGSNDFGNLNIPAGNNYVAVAAGGTHAVALRFNGSLAAWGSNSVGQLFVPPGNNFVAISAGLLHSLALRSDGSIVGWGSNGSGQINVPAGNDFVAISAGSDFSVAIRSNGTLVAWGNNDLGQRNVPGGTTFTEIDAGAGHGVALRSDGSLASWGNNIFGLVANTPAGNNFAAVSGGPNYSLALRSNGTIAGWGSLPPAPSLPGNLPTGNDFVAIEASQAHSLALRSDGSLFAWGSNFVGQTNVPPGDIFVAISAVAPGGTVSSSYNLVIQVPEPNMPGLVGDVIVLFATAQTAGPGAISQTARGVSHSLLTHSDGELVMQSNTASRSFVFDPDNAGGDPISTVLSAMLDGTLTAEAGGMASVEASMMVRDTLGQVIGADSRLLDTGPGALPVDQRFHLPLLLTPGKTYEMVTTLSLAAQNGTADFADTFTVEFVVPEPVSTSLALFAVAAIACLRRRNK